MYNKETKLDVLINNAGIANLSQPESSLNCTSEWMTKSFTTNAIGPLLVAQKSVPLLKNSSHPKIINISSRMGSIGDNLSSNAVSYRVSKAALNMGLIKIIINLISPLRSITYTSHSI